jgi:glycosyltransferase involved in cell wall biosynthesis
MKILFLSQRFLFPSDTGGKIRTGNILRELNKKVELTIISNVESPKDDPYLNQMSELCARFIPVSWNEMKRYTMAFYFKLAIQSLSKYPISVLNDYSKTLEETLKKELSSTRYDLVICDFLQSTLNFKDVKEVPRLLFQHNVEAQITKRHLAKAGNSIEKLFWSLQHKRMLRHEGNMCRKFEGTIAVSEEDKSLIETWYEADHVYTIPTGVDPDFFSPLPVPEKKKQLVFTGSMDWLPNDDAMAWFLNEIFSGIQEREPGTSLVIVGRKPTPRIEKLVNGRKDITVTGWVDDTRPFISESAVYIVPIRIGGGTRMKIYEALAMGKALVSTTVGAEGLPLENGEHILRADSAADFRDCVVNLLRDAKLRDRLGKAAREYVRENYRWEKVADRFLDICETVSTDGQETLNQAS